MTRTESIFLRKILPSYYTYVSQQPDTLLPKFFGMHRVKRKKQKIYFLIQQNVFYSDVDDIHGQYDLKGSTQGRRATKAERKKGAILKDLDWVDEDKEIKIGPSRAKLFKDQLKRDTQWLRTEKIMDYSLLVGIHYRDKAKNNTHFRYNSTNTNLDLPPNDSNIVLDHSENESKFQPELQTVEEDIEDNEEDNPQQIPHQISTLSALSSPKEITPNPSITPFHPGTNIEEEEEEVDHAEVEDDENIIIDEAKVNNDNNNETKPTTNKITDTLPKISSTLATNNSNIKITITPTSQPPPQQSTVMQSNASNISTDSNGTTKYMDYMIKPSQTEHTGTEEESDYDDDNLARISLSDNEANISKIRSQSADIKDDPTELKYDEYDDDQLLTEDSMNGGSIIPNRRSSAPMIVSPKSDSEAINSSPNKRKFKLFNFGSSIPNKSNGNKSGHDKHTHSHSLQADSLHNIISELATPKPKLHASSSEKPASIRSKYKNKMPLKPLRMKNSYSSANVQNNNQNRSSSPMYRGHISVKHPKRYKRKTAAEMQFAPEDIHIPAGIKHEVAEEKKNGIKFNKMKEKQGSHEITRSDTNNSNSNSLINDENESKKDSDSNDTESKPKPKRQRSILSSFNATPSANGTMDHLNVDDESNGDAAMSGDICPWTTYHGGMVFEDDDGNLGNEVYFVGLIDILQKYNKRKKLENWIKKMKYDKNSISAAPPDLYAQRMCDFFDDKVV